MKTRFGVFSVILALLTGTGWAEPASQPEKEGGDNAFTAAPEVVESPVPKRQKGTVLAGVLNVRARPGLRFEVIAKLRKDDPVTVVAEEQDWFGIAVPKIAKAYIAARFLGPDGTVIGDKVRVRSGPGLVFTPYAELHEGEKVEPQGDPENGWQRITPRKTAWGGSTGILSQSSPRRNRQKHRQERAPRQRPASKKLPTKRRLKSLSRKGRRERRKVENPKATSRLW